MIKTILMGLILVMGITTSVLASTTKTFTGTLGKYPIMLSLRTDGFSSYLYTRHLKQIHLTRKDNGTTIMLYQRLSQDKDPIEQFTLHYVGKKLEGTWQHKHTTLPVTLSPSRHSMRHYQENHQKFITTGNRTFAKHTLRLVKEVHTNFHFYRLDQGFSHAQKRRINGLLSDIHRSFVSNVFQCRHAEYSPHISLVSSQAISFYVNYELDCGGAHPNYGVLTYNFNLHTHTQMKRLTDRFPGLDVFPLLKKKYANGKWDTNIPECHYFQSPDNWQYAHWRLTPDGVVIIPAYPHAMAPCEQAFTLTNHELAGHWQQP